MTPENDLRRFIVRYVAGCSSSRVGPRRIVTSGVKTYGAASGSSKVEGRARETTDEIATQIKPRFQEQGWIP